MASIVEGIKSVEEFQHILSFNPGVVVLKFGATWCRPCKQIEPYLHDVFSTLPPNVHVYLIDIDRDEELYRFFTSKKRVRGVPAVLAYVQGNNTYLPNWEVSGTNIQALNTLFGSCANTAHTIQVVAKAGAAAAEL